MNILFCSVPFRPSIGGIETVSALLAERFHRAGHTVTLVTQSEAEGPDADAFRVLRRPSARQLFDLVREADVVFHNNISLRLAWPLLLLRRPWVIAHHTWIPARGLAGRVKRSVLRFASHIAVSRAIADSLPEPAAVVPNPYADDLFQPMPRVMRQGDVVFVGRLVSDKGVDLLLEALGLLAGRGRHVNLTIVGDGPEAPKLRERAQKLGVADQVHFAGRRVGVELVKTLNAHQVMAVPSVWEEPFGVVALEGMACGCVPLVARSGGLPEAVGACGLVVARGSPETLAAGIEALIGDPSRLARYRIGVAAHLERHTPERVARAYLKVIEHAYRSHSTQSPARAV